jgi:chromosome segregation ATPase
LVESAIFFLIGFLTAAFFALLAAPAISRRARRLAEARARLQSPLSETQARAERDALRGQHAVELVRLETRLKVAENDRAIDRVTHGRQASRIVALEDLSEERAAEIARQRAELADLQRESIDLNAQHGAQEIALRDVTFQRDDADGAVALARSTISGLETQVDENRAVIASLEAQATNLRLEIADLRRAAAAAEAERGRLSAAISERIGAAHRLKEELEGAAGLTVRLLLESDGRAAEAARLRVRLDEVEPRLARSEAAREEIAREHSRQVALLVERDESLDEAEAAHRELGVKHDAMAMQNQSLTTSHAAMEGALRALRSDRAELQREVDRLRARLAESASAAQTAAKGDQALRQSIARLGREIARGVAAPDEDEPLPGQIVNFARREPAATGNYSAESPAGAALRQDQPIASER